MFRIVHKSIAQNSILYYLLLTIKKRGWEVGSYNICNIKSMKSCKE
jgi:hypothetical protein